MSVRWFDGRQITEGQRQIQETRRGGQGPEEGRRDRKGELELELERASQEGQVASRARAGREAGERPFGACKLAGAPMKESGAHGTRYVTFPATTAALGGFLFGFDSAVINGAVGGLQWPRSRSHG